MGLTKPIGAYTMSPFVTAGLGSSLWHNLSLLSSCSLVWNRDSVLYRIRMYVCHDLTSQGLAAKSLLCVPEETLDLDL